MKAKLHATLVESTLSLFTAFGVALRPVMVQPAAPQATNLAIRSGDDLTAALVTFTGTGIRGTLALEATFELFASCRPKEAKARRLSAALAGDWLYVRDWSKELANQLLGRVKRHMVSQGVTFEIGTPVALTGPARKGALGSLKATPARFTSSLGEVTVWLDVTMGADVEERLGAPVNNALHIEGDIVLF